MPYQIHASKKSRNRSIDLRLQKVYFLLDIQIKDNNILTSILEEEKKKSQFFYL